MEFDGKDDWCGGDEFNLVPGDFTIMFWYLPREITAWKRVICIGRQYWAGGICVNDNRFLLSTDVLTVYAWINFIKDAEKLLKINNGVIKNHREWTSAPELYFQYIKRWVI